MTTNKELDRLDRLNNKLDLITTRLDQIENPNTSYTDNNGAKAKLGVGDRTLQTYRNKGLVAFSQVGSKIWYKISDLQEFLEKHRRAAK